MTDNKPNGFKEKAVKALNKKAGIGDDIDTALFSMEQPKTTEIKDLNNISEELKKTLINVGIDTTQKDRSGTYILEGNKVGFCKTVSDKVEVLPISEALEKYDWLKDYYWKAVSVDTDKYTAETELQQNLQGYFIYAKEGAKDTFPLQSCLFLNIEGMKQIVHNIIIAEPNSELNIITGCTVHPNIHKALHLGTSEFYLKKNSNVSFTMIHYWSDESMVRPRTGIIQEANSKFFSNYIVMSPVKSLQSNPITYLNGDNASAYFQTLIHGKGDSMIDVGGRAHLNGKNTKAELISRIIGDNKSWVISRGEITGSAEEGLGHIECKGLLISPNAKIDSIPRINAHNPTTSLTHEAAVGRIGNEQLLYLSSRGLSEEEARDLIISGFLEADTSNLPPELAKETERLIELASKAEG
ncbi:MAG: SufB/SufD family protein [Promethearchaeota archaeon]